MWSSADSESSEAGGECEVARRQKLLEVELGVLEVGVREEPYPESVERAGDAASL